MSRHRLDRGLGTRVLAGLLFGTLTAIAAAATPFLNGPSLIGRGETAVVSGGNFPPGIAITVMVTQPDGTTTGHSAVVGADGSVRHDLRAGLPGKYRVRVTDSSGRALATATVGFSR